LSSSQGTETFLATMSEVSAGLLFALVLLLTTNLTVHATPLLLLWGISPVIVWQIGKSHQMKPLKTRLSAEELKFLNKLCRKTWEYFATFVTPEEHYFPPDNYHELPIARTAHYTSPTNIGFGLLANLSAYDFAYISAEEFRKRTQDTLMSLEKLEKYKGHLYNWYDTNTLSPSRRCISSVDSGNLMASLIVLRQALLQLPDSKLFETKIFAGLLTTLELALEENEIPKNFYDRLEETIGVLRQALRT